MESREDIIIPKKSSKVPVVATEKSGKEEKPVKPSPLETQDPSSFKPNAAKKSHKGLFIGIIITVLALGGGVTYYILNNPSSENPSEETTPEEEGTSAEVEVLYVTPEDSEDPVGDFTAHLEEEKAKATNHEEAVEAEHSLIAFNIAIEKYDEALAGLNNFDTSEFSEEEWYRYYNTYVNYYKSRGLDEENALLDEYSQKAADAFNRYVNEVDETAESTESGEEEAEDAE